jgi:hypothetical protein
LGTLSGEIKKMKKRIVSLLSIALMISMIMVSPASADSGIGSFGGGFQPGDPITLEQKIPLRRL